jgi:rSAM/selenodomain-associated transferase 2
MQIAVIIPALNEAARLGGLLRDLAENHGFSEVVVVDGGSADGTLEIARSAAGVTALSAPRGRAPQMNAGAAAAGAEALLFLHADARLPPGAAGQIRAALADPAVVGGAFRTWTVPDPDAPRAWLGPLLHLADLRSRYTRAPYGDQGIFVRADVFRALGGFPAQPLMEDLAFSRALRRRGRLARAPGRVLVSGRRFQRHPLYYLTLMNALPLLYRAGVPLERLARLY